MITNLCRTCTRYLGPLSLAIALIFYVLSSPAYAAQLYQYKSNGNFANVEWLTADLVYGLINVSQCGSVKSPQTCLNYYVYDYNTNTEIAYAFGNIPNNDLTGNLHTGLHLRTDTSRVTDGNVGGEGAVISLDWVKFIDTGGSSLSGTQESHSGNIVFRQSGTTHFDAASVNGTAGSYTFPVSSEDYIFNVWMGNNNLVSVQIQTGQ